MKITEWCGYCENEVKIDDCGVSVCPICGEKILPCSQCDMDKVDCNNCVWEVEHEKVCMLSLRACM